MTFKEDDMGGKFALDGGSNTILRPSGTLMVDLWYPDYGRARLTICA